MSSKRHLALIGLMGAGKTSVGERCAERLQRPFVDTDLLVESMTGRTISELFANGEEEFRSWEREAVANACASPQPLVIAEGGGAVVDSDNRRRVRATCYVVWLRATPEVLASRVGTDRVNRPLLATYGHTATLARLAEARAVHYEAASDAAVDTDSRTVDEVTDAVLELYRP
jgi:shikimate kinase